MSAPWVNQHNKELEECSWTIMKHHREHSLECWSGSAIEAEILALMKGPKLAKTEDLSNL